VERAHGGGLEFAGHFSAREKEILREHHEGERKRMDDGLASVRDKRDS
jgi:hypothetical protein